MSLNRRQLVSLALLLATLGAACTAWGQSQDYPNRPIRLISPYAPGGGNDTIARILADKLTVALGQRVFVDNRPGGNTTLGNDLVAKATPDGYTLIVNGNGFVINPNFYSKLPFDTAKDIAPVSFIGFSTLALVSNAALPAKTVPELLALAKSKPGQLNFGTSGHGGPDHLAGVLFNQLAGVDIASIPYRGIAPASADLLGGQVQLMFAPLGVVLPFVNPGKMRLLAVATQARSVQVPDVPTLAEAGVPGYEAFLWYGIMTTAGTPEPIIRRLNDEIGKILQQKEVSDKLMSIGTVPGGPAYATPERFSAFIRAELSKTASITKNAGIKPE